ncbi:dynamin family protein [Crocosphaera sp. UHCC 0190]|uniref:dynamin family protein n=1 Tax=Crocosphaera sp. UHCC 0190 TaxID=3110246 RepID=UPI002B21A891|nr:dynamin family protein [Crocosphaera sp. UHCC 0190]MEA5512308.1 dynamin family protein [Crocosphaera sp. UHCC 0190]
MDIESKLNISRKLLQELGIALSDLVNTAADVFEDSVLKSRLKDFRRAYDEARQRLENPSLCIATLGTTSSGKSTIVNALMGRRIAPIEAGEMSGGILKLKHSNDHKLIIEETPDAVWETGEWISLNDEEIYNRIQQVMHTYHEARKKKEYVAPQITSYVPLLPACDSILSGLPEGISIEFLDLPGLKSVQDRTNLAIIQPQVGKAFSLVALDYMQVDEQHRQRLLEELKRVVEYLQGRTDSMIFILNRVDQRGSDDLPLNERLEKLKLEIQTTLNLPKLPDVIPFNARLLYYAQCAWGTTSLNTPSNVTPDRRQQLLNSLFRDCATVIKENVTGDRDLKKWFRQLEDNLEDGCPPDDYQMRRIMFYALRWSGGQTLWNCIRIRLQESFSELVILPALLDVFNGFDALKDALNILIETRQINNQEEVTAEKAKVTQIRQDLEKNLKKINGDFKKEVKNIVEALKTNEPKVIDKIKQEAQAKKREGFSYIFEAVSFVEGDLTKSLIVPVRNAFQNNQSAYELEEKLSQIVTPALAKDIAKQYDNVSCRIEKFSVVSDDLQRKVRADNQQAIQEIEHDERYVRLLYHTMRRAITARAEFSLQGKAKQFEDALQSLVNEQLKRLKICLSQQELHSVNFDIEQAVMSDLHNKLTQNLPTLPEKFFEIKNNIEQRNITENEIVDTEEYEEQVKKTKYEKYKESYSSGSCFKQTKTRTRKRPVEYIETVTKTRDIYEDIEYIELLLPSPSTMAKQWSEGIKEGKEQLWDLLCDWIISRLDYVSNIFEESIIDITNLAERALAEQARIIDYEFEAKKQFWANIEVKQAKVIESVKQLEKEVKQNESVV